MQRRIVEDLATGDLMNGRYWISRGVLNFSFYNVSCGNVNVVLLLDLFLEAL